MKQQQFGFFKNNTSQLTSLYKLSVIRKAVENKIVEKNSGRVPVNR